MHLSFDIIPQGMSWKNWSQQTDELLNKHMLVSSQIQLLKMQVKDYQMGMSRYQSDLWINSNMIMFLSQLLINILSKGFHKKIYHTKGISCSAVVREVFKKAWCTDGLIYLIDSTWSSNKLTVHGLRTFWTYLSFAQSFAGWIQTPKLKGRFLYHRHDVRVAKHFIWMLRLFLLSVPVCDNCLFFQTIYQ